MIRLGKIILLLITIMASYSCHMNMPRYTLLDYTYSAGIKSESFSLSINNNGESFLHKNNIKGNKFFSKKLLDLKDMDIALKQIKQSKLHSTYEQYIVDGNSFKAIIYTSNKKTAKYLVHAEDYPEPLQNLEKLCKKISEEKGWTELKDTTILFESYPVYPIPIERKDRVKFPPVNK